MACKGCSQPWASLCSTRRPWLPCLLLLCCCGVCPCGCGSLAQPRLQVAAEKKAEELKEQMMGQLKELGNSLLGKFGMSLDNFKAEKDPNTGSYNISFQR